MGKRKKSTRKPGGGSAKMAPLDKSFRCLFCQHTGTVSCKIDNKNKVGRLDCKDCGQNFTTDVNHLTAPIDIYAEWIDACEEVNPLDGSPPPARAPKKRAAPTQDDLDDDEDLPDLGGGKRRKEVPVEEEEEEEEEEEDLPELDMSRRQVVSDDEE